MSYPFKIALLFSIIFCCFLVSFSSCSDKPVEYGHSYVIDPNIKSDVEKNIIGSNGFYQGQMELTLYEDDSLFFDSEILGRKLDFFTLAFLRHDTLDITGFSGMFAGLGFNLVLTKDTCQAFYYAKTDAFPGIYKFNKQDTVYTSGIAVPSSYSKVILADKPKYKNGEIIEGYLELKSLDFYEKDGANDKKYRANVKAYFKGEVKTL